MSVRPRPVFGGRLRGLFRAPVRISPAPRLKGKMRRAIVVPTPGEMFSEAVFVLRDDKLRAPGLDQDALLKEAARAAEGSAKATRVAARAIARRKPRRSFSRLSSVE